MSQSPPSQTSTPSPPSRNPLVLIARALCMYTILNLLVIVTAAVWLPVLRGFALCNTIFVLTLTTIMKSIDPIGSLRPFHSFGMYDSRLIALCDLTTHLLPLLFILPWVQHVTISSAVAPIIIAPLYSLVANIRWIYGADYTENNLTTVLCIVVCYVVLLFSCMFSLKNMTIL